jgi:hypothetical protein
MWEFFKWLIEYINYNPGVVGIPILIALIFIAFILDK